MKTNILCICLISLMFWSCSNKEQKKPETYNKIPNSILIVYSTGTPYKTLSDIKPEEVDGVTGATPTDMNVGIISGALVKNLRAKNYTVRIAKASEIKDYRELLQYDMLIIGTPTYFWNMQWEVKQMMDECFEKIYIARRDDFKKMKHIVFAMAEYGPCGENAVKQMGFGITDCSAKVDTSMVFITKQTRPQYDNQIAKLVVLADSVMRVK